MTDIHDPWGDSFTPQEHARLAPFVTSPDATIFGLRNLPEVVKGALFSRYSRTDKSLRRILLDEFINTPESDFDAIVGGASLSGSGQMQATRQAEAFYDRVLIGYGDDSVAELGGAHVACEGISNIAAKALEDSRIGISPLEKSTRYVVFNRKVNGRYRYVREQQIMRSRYAGAYEHALDGLFDTYSALLDPTIAWVRSTSPRDATTSERAYQSATRAKACDLLRGLLPMATLTNVGLFGNGRAFEYLLTKLYAAPLTELNELGTSLQEALDDLIPSFVKRAKQPRGKGYQQHINGLRQRAAILAAPLQLPVEPAPSSTTLISYDADAEQRVIAAVLYPHTDVTLETVQSYVATLSAEERASILRDYIGQRANRFHKPGRPFEEARYTFDILADIGAYRDLQRHRILTQERQPYTVDHGFVLPGELHEAGLAQPFTDALERAAELVSAMRSDMPEAAQYAVPFAFRVRWRVTINLRALYHLAELRATPQGHPAYRQIAQDMYQAVRDVHPVLAEAMQVDMHSYQLERLDAERRIDAKIAARQQ